MLCLVELKCCIIYFNYETHFVSQCIYNWTEVNLQTDSLTLSLTLALTLIKLLTQSLTHVFAFVVIVKAVNLKLAANFSHFNTTN